MTDTAWKKFWKRLRLVSVVEVNAPNIAVFQETGTWRRLEESPEKHFFRLIRSDLSFYLFKCDCGHQHLVAKTIWRNMIADGVQTKINRIYEGTSTTDPFVEFNGNWVT